MQKILIGERKKQEMRVSINSEPEWQKRGGIDRNETKHIQMNRQEYRTSAA